MYACEPSPRSRDTDRNALRLYEQNELVPMLDVLAPVTLAVHSHQKPLPGQWPPRRWVKTRPWWGNRPDIWGWGAQCRERRQE